MFNMRVEHYCRKRVMYWAGNHVWSGAKPDKNSSRRIEMPKLVHARSSISGSSWLVQPSGGFISPHLMSTNSLIMGILHMSMSLSSLYWIFFTALGQSSSTLDRFVLSRIFLRFDPVVVLTSSFAMLYSCFTTGLLDFLMLEMKLKKFLIRVVLMCCWSNKGSSKFRCVGVVLPWSSVTYCRC